MPRTEGRSDRESLRVTYMGESSSGLAWKIAVEGSKKEVWVPVSQCELVPANPSVGDSCWLMVPQWLIDKAGLD